MGKTPVIRDVSLGGRGVEDRHALIIQNRGSIRCRFVFHIARREIQYALSSVPLAREGKRGLLREGLLAAWASPANDQTNERLNQLLAKDVELSRTGLMPFEQVRRGFTDGAPRQFTADLVAQNVVAILFDFHTGG